MQTAVQISHNGATFFSQGRLQDAMTCFRHALFMLKTGIRNDVNTSSYPCVPQDLPVASLQTSKRTVSFYADGLALQPVSLAAPLLGRGDERSIIVSSAVAVFNLAISHHAISLQARERGEPLEDVQFYMTSAMKLYTLVQSLQQQADSHQEDPKLVPVEQRESLFVLESMIRIATLHNCGVLLVQLDEPGEAHEVFEHLFHVIFSLRITPRDSEASTTDFDLNAVMARVFLEMNILKESHTAPCA